MAASPPMTTYLIDPRDYVGLNGETLETTEPFYFYPYDITKLIIRCEFGTTDLTITVDDITEQVPSEAEDDVLVAGYVSMFPDLEEFTYIIERPEINGLEMIKDRNINRPPNLRAVSLPYVDEWGAFGVDPGIKFIEGVEELHIEHLSPGDTINQIEVGYIPSSVKVFVVNNHHNDGPPGITYSQRRGEMSQYDPNRLLESMDCSMLTDGFTETEELPDLVAVMDRISKLYLDTYLNLEIFAFGYHIEIGQVKTMGG